jgi:hypothetical protein
MAWPIIRRHILVMFEPCARHEQQDNENDEVSLTARENKQREQPLHLCA